MDVGPAWPGLLDRIRRFGPLRFGQFVDSCLYGPDGFYTAGRGAGRRADFLTSPEVGPLFGAVVARAVDAEWRRCGCPDPFVVVEAGAATGNLAAAVLASPLTCAPALRYVAVEISPALRASAAERLPVELPAFVLGPSTPSGQEGAAVTGRGPLVTVLGDLPAQTFTGMVIANELLDNLSVDLLEFRDDGWWDVRVGATDNGEPTEVLVPAEESDAAEAARLVAGAPPMGSRIPLQHAAREWIGRALGLVERGRVVCIDYAVGTTAELVLRPWTTWLRTYRGHGFGKGPLDAAGDQDITCDVAVDQLSPSPELDTPQSEWLDQHGLDDLVDAARDRWDAAAARPDVGALQARSTVHEAAALLDQSGLGAFRVLEWRIR